jgi:hypothetical protein
LNCAFFIQLRLALFHCFPNTIEEYSMNGLHLLLLSTLPTAALLTHETLATPSTAAAASVETSSLQVPLPPGETPLADIGVYRVFWQSYGRDPVEMPISWSGHFEPRAGISYQGRGRILNRRALLMHSPWHMPPGKTWVDYQLILPRVTPIRLTFGIAMGPDVATPDRSDGVTFSCYLTVDGTQQQLMRQHYDKARWQDFEFDLSPHAGKTLTLRLQVEPGPNNSSSFDFSYFGNARVIVGDTTPEASDIVRRLTECRSYQALKQADLTQLSNRTDCGVLPGNLLPHKNDLEQVGTRWRFTYVGDDCHVVYDWTPETGTLEDFRVQVDDGRPILPAQGGGATATLIQSDKSEEVALRGGRAVEVKRDADELHVLWEYDVQGRALRIAWTYGILGKALAVTARCDDPVVSRFSMGDVGMAPLCRRFPVPYLLGQVAYLPVQNVFVCRYLNWTKSNASRCPQGVADYEPKTDGTRNPLFETGYIALSPDVGEVLPNIPQPASPYRTLLGPLIMLDVWGHHEGTYQGDADNLWALKDHGVDHLAIISHVWQRYGYDVKLPDHLPANPSFGGDEGMVVFGQAANECGYIWSLHENYIDLYPDAPSYDPAARVLKTDGTPSPAWYNAGTKVQSFGLKCNRALGYAKQNAPEVHKRFRTTAAYLDVHTCVPPWHQLDHEADQPMAAMARAKVKYDTELFQFMRRAHKGPLFGEGANHFFWAGQCDGVEAQVRGGEDHAPFLDFDLLKVHPQMVNHGMGYYERWFRRGYDHRWGDDTGTMEQIDKYRAQELAYGHAGFIGAAQVDNLPWVIREHHLMHPVQRLYGTAKPVEILYEVDGQLVTASVALVADDTSRQRITYDSGLRLWSNWRAEPWLVEGRVLPQWGFLALGPDTEVSTTLREGKWADYAECPEYIFADARTHFPMPYRRSRTDIEPRLSEFEYLGGNRARVTYQWLVNETLDRDYFCFVHGIHSDQRNPEDIHFQQDHALPKPTTEWRPGDVIVDGPYDLVVSTKHDAYDLVMGLHRGERARLKGVQKGGDRVYVARLELQKQGDRITDITAKKITKENTPETTTAADFTAHLNPPGTWIDFGPVASDGSAKIQREAQRLVVFPYPRDKAFRISLDLSVLAPSTDPKHVKVQALAAGTQQPLGPADCVWKNDRLVLTAGLPDAGRYVVTWSPSTAGN